MLSKKDKKAVSAIVATILLIAIVVAATGLIRQRIIPMAAESLGISKACMNAKVSIDTKSSFTCYNPQNNEVSVMLSRGTGDFQLLGIDLIVSGGGVATSFIINNRADPKIRMYSGDYNSMLELPNKEEKKTYVLNVSSLSEVWDLRVAPIVRLGVSEQVCGITSRVQVPNCW